MIVKPLSTLGAVNEPFQGTNTEAFIGTKNVTLGRRLSTDRFNYMYKVHISICPGKMVKLM